MSPDEIDGFLESERTLVLVTLRPGCYQLDARIDDRNANGVLGSMCLPSFSAFCRQVVYGAKDKDLALAVRRAYNDWHIDEWCGGASGRFIPLAMADCAADLLWSLVLRNFSTLRFALSEAGVGWMPCAPWQRTWI
jgi:hypothetical protein